MRITLGLRAVPASAACNMGMGARMSAAIAMMCTFTNFVLLSVGFLATLGDEFFTSEIAVLVSVPFVEARCGFCRI